jgi:crossover junction endodeoxyribonuclease RuvC
MTHTRKNPVAGGVADRASKTFILAAERAEDSQTLAELQDRSLLDHASATSLCIAAFDPGSSSGAVAFYFTAHPGQISAEDLPVVAGQVDSATLAARLKQMRPDVAVIERVAAMPRQGVSSTFKFGTAYGILQGVVAALEIPVHFVAPGRWKKHFGLTSDKEQSRARALQLWPGQSDLFARKKDHGRAESALLARYFAEIRGARS